MDQQAGGTQAVEFAFGLQKLRALFEQFCRFDEEFGPHGMFGQMSRTEPMRHAYLHIDHHLRQFGVYSLGCNNVICSVLIAGKLIRFANFCR